MPSGKKIFVLSVALLATIGIVGCAGTNEEELAAAAEAEQWAAVEQAKADLDAKRQELRDLRARVAEAGDSAAAEAEAEVDEAGEDLEAQVEEVQKELDEMSTAFTSQLIDYINSQEILEGAELTPNQRQAFDWKSEEDMLVAQEYIDRAGDYQKAIDIYTTALLADPGNEKILAAKEKAEELRYMTEDRFAQIKKGMTPEQVREALGTPHRMNVREFEDGITGWFYPKQDPPRSAAGVYFQKKRDKLTVYRAEYDAIKGGDEG